MFIVIRPGPVIFFAALVDNRYTVEMYKTYYCRRCSLKFCIVSVFGISFQVRWIGTCLPRRPKSSSRLQRNSRARAEVRVEGKTPADGVAGGSFREYSRIDAHTCVVHVRARKRRWIIHEFASRTRRRVIRRRRWPCNSAGRTRFDLQMRAKARAVGIVCAPCTCADGRGRKWFGAETGTRGGRRQLDTTNKRGGFGKRKFGVGGGGFEESRTKFYAETERAAGHLLSWHANVYIYTHIYIFMYIYVCIGI